MDSQSGIEMETKDCVSERLEEQPATSTKHNTDSNDSSVNNTNGDATIDAANGEALGTSTTNAAINANAEPADGTRTDTAIGTNTEAAINLSTPATIDTTTDTVSDTATDITIDTSTDAAVLDESPNAGMGINTDLAVDRRNDAVFRGNTEAAIDAVETNIDATINESAIVDVDTSNDTFACGKIESALMDVVDTRIDGAINECPDVSMETVTEPDVNASSVTAHNANPGDALNSKKAVCELNCPSSTGSKMILHSGDTALTTSPKSKACHIDSEVEIIDCTSKRQEDHPANTSTTINNQIPEFSIDHSDDASMDGNSDAAVNPSGRSSFSTALKTSRRKKKEVYENRCRNLRLYKLRKKSGETDQASKSKPQKVSLCLDKLTKNNMKFMENFDPKRSNRERRKLLRKSNARRELRSELYGLNGALVSSGKNLCDCMDPLCPGCHFPCPRCQSPKCGHECRVNRKWTYEEIEIDGTDIVIKPHELIQSFGHKI